MPTAVRSARKGRREEKCGLIACDRFIAEALKSFAKAPAIDIAAISQLRAGFELGWSEAHADQRPECRQLVLDFGAGLDLFEQAKIEGRRAYRAWRAEKP